MENLDPGQARGGQADDLIVGDEQRAVRTRVGDDGAHLLAARTRPMARTGSSAYRPT